MRSYNGPPKTANPFAQLFQPSIDWNVPLHNANRWYDRMAKTLRNKDRAEREKQLTQIEKELDELVRKSHASKPGMLGLLFTKDSDKIRGEQIGNIMIGLLAPAIHKVQNAEDRCDQMQRNLYLAFALAAYQRDNGRYPKQLDALTPKYLDKVSNDMFSGKPLVYRPAENGYLLYSVGVNGRDEQGRNWDDDPKGDDLTVHMPLSKPSTK
jgi:hypothetical protein